MKHAIAFFIDLFGSFIIIGSIIGTFTGDTTVNGSNVSFQLSGMPALLLFVGVFLYFYLSKKYMGQTVGQKMLGISK